MLNYRLLQQLAPLNFRDESKTEALPDYLARVAPLVPFIPDNVLSQWIYRHWRGFESNWSFIDLARHQFECESWPTARIIEQTGSRHMEVVERWGEMLKHNRYVRRSWLGEYMLSQGTWSEPIIVLASAAGSSYPDGHPLPQPYCLLEGHHRLAYLRSMAEDAQPLQAEHQVWVCRPVHDS
ncbi:TPA: hypothetical protein ACGY8I_003438 [Aeromonas hydrophila]|uniref:hypothetical protein n=1 Tax=Aeromonas hydrophila TaxID=644 RepID=UPI0004939966|nr:hypothetical protein [Aeromonas hydrophila]MBL0571206.1 hypothetical protein [Aeromonas hydrophila]QWL77940.1 hypothetical protein HQ395_03645 [Aeromonas hydrophila]WAG15858.1 hypothetical protein NRZ29_01200 [Aeromonas hydrophila]